LRVISLLYGVVSYISFLGVFCYFIAFDAGIFVPKSLNSAASTGVGVALAVNCGLMMLFGVQHSVMARSGFKASIEKLIPHHLERSTYVLATNIVLVFFMLWWQPIDGNVWSVENPIAQKLMWGIFSAGWVLVLISTFLTDHFDLFGLRQVWLNFLERTYTEVRFTERFIYHWIRHPMMLGLLIAFWVVPVMTMGHLLFSAGMSLYIFVGIYLEEKSLLNSIGDHYAVYQKKTARVIPGIY